jgi:hypothetical protein
MNKAANNRIATFPCNLVLIALPPFSFSGCPYSFLLEKNPGCNRPVSAAAANGIITGKFSGWPKEAGCSARISPPSLNRPAFFLDFFPWTLNPEP